MKKIGLSVVLAMLAVFAAHGAPGQVATNGVTLAWEYPTNGLTPDLVFKLYSTTNAATPVASWPLAKQIASTNGVPSGTNKSFTTPFPMQAEARFFTMTASNFWGESTFSAVAATPPAPRFDVPLSIGLAP